jgi:hypothetical protein
VIVEKLIPGPIRFSLPSMTVPILVTGSWEDTVMLSLYYRWVLQALSAFKFLHSRSVYLKSFSSEFVWLRSDYSLAITGFISASAPEIEKEFRTDGINEINKREREEAEQLGTVPIVLNEEDENVSGCCLFWDEGEWVGDGEFTYDEILNKSPETGSVEEDLSVEPCPSCPYKIDTD